MKKRRFHFKRGEGDGRKGQVRDNLSQMTGMSGDCRRERDGVRRSRVEPLLEMRKVESLAISR